MTSGIDETPASAPPPPTAAPKPNSFQRIIGSLMSPNETFASIAAVPDWVVPLVLWVILGAIGGAIFANRVDFASAVRESMEQRGDVPPESIDRAARMASSGMKVFAYLSPVITVLSFLLIAAILMVAFRAMGGEGTFKQSFSASLYAWTPNIIQGVILWIVILARPGIRADQIPVVVRSNLAFLTDMKTHPMLFALLGSVDVFTIWTAVLFIIAFAYIAKVSKGKSAAIVVSLLVVFDLLKLIPAALRAMK